MGSLRIFGVAIGATWLAGCIDASGTMEPQFDAGGLDVAQPDATLPPVVVIGSDPVVDFGPVDCGGSAPAPRTFTVKNTGTIRVHYALSLSTTSAFQIQGATSGDVDPGASATATIAATAVPASATAGALDQATLTIATSDPALPSSTIAVKRTASGGTLVLAPATADFGDVPVSATSPALPLALSNAGNAPVQVTIATPTDPQFAIAGAGAATTIAAGSAFPSLSATFAPTAKASAAASAAIAVTGAVCGASVTSIPLQGNGVAGIVAVSPGTLDFGSVDCGKTGPAQSVTVNNSGNASVHFNAALLAAAGSAFTVAPATGTIGAGQSATITVTPKAIPQVASVAANAFGDTLRITSDAPGDSNHDVKLTETAHGAVLTLDKTSEPFGDTTLQTTATLPFSITNNGNAPATITLKATGPGFGVAPTGATTLAAGASPLAGTASFKPGALGTANGSIAIATGASDAVCSAPIGPIALTGNGVNGTLTLSTKTIDFLTVFCGQKAAPQTFTVSNTGTAPFSWSAALGKGGASPYALDVTSGTLAAGAKTTVTVTPAAIPQTSALTPNLYGDTITITPTGINGGTAQTIALAETAKGGVVTVSPSSVPFPNTAEGQQSAAATLTLTNTGTTAVTITPTISGGDSSSFLLATPGAHALAASGGNYSPGPTFKPQASGALASSVALAVGVNDVLCQPLPAAPSLSGTGTNGVLQLGTSSIAFAAQPCGAAALTQTLKLTNNGNGAMTFNAKVLGTTGFQVSPPTGNLAANGGFANLTITSPTFPTTLGNVNAVNDQLQITTNAFGDSPHVVPLSSTPSGAILALTQGSLPFGTVQANKGASLPLTVKNNGNASATVSFALGGGGTNGPDFSFSPQNTPLASGGTLNAQATFDPPTSIAESNTVAVQVPNGTPLCGALPAAISASGTGAQGVFGGIPTGMAFNLTCNASPVAQTFQLTNQGSLSPTVVPYDFNASIGAGWTVSPLSGTVDPGKTVTVTVTPPAEASVTPGTANNVTLTITTDIPGDTAHTAPVDGTASGASLTMMSAAGAPEPSITINTGFGTVNYTTFIDNGGNAAATIDYVIVPDPANSPQVPLTASPAPSPPFQVQVGANNTVTYAWTWQTGVPPIATYKYTVYFPATDGEAGVCSARTVQTVTVNVNTS